MRRQSLKRHGLIVTQEAIQDFKLLKSSDRLAWLDQMREFIFNLKKKKIRKAC